MWLILNTFTLLLYKLSPFFSPSTSNSKSRKTQEAIHILREELQNTGMERNIIDKAWIESLLRECRKVPLVHVAWQQRVSRDLNAAQTCLNEKLLEVNICLCSVFSVTLFNYSPVRLLTMENSRLHQTGKIGFPPRLTCCDGALRYRAEARVRLISCLFLWMCN